MLTLIPVLLAIGRRKVQIDNTLKKIIHIYRDEAMDHKEILRYLTSRYHFRISLNILKKHLRAWGQRHYDIYTINSKMAKFQPPGPHPYAPASNLSTPASNAPAPAPIPPTSAPIHLLPHQHIQLILKNQNNQLHNQENQNNDTLKSTYPPSPAPIPPTSAPIHLLPHYPIHLLLQHLIHLLQHPVHLYQLQCTYSPSI